ncbi:MAG TPA: methyltransferase domain-containing protein [Sphingopyxis sp.]|nr:methyltransferase domain-containing protein [Sphingopyxis sp.]HMP43782.1 methyltransferase domain-containing protein [Sphingopyxis sp.]HMQ17517.1 methyltransferase domain-containing protein [Sphingopyxis sp.]
MYSFRPVASAALIILAACSAPASNATAGEAAGDTATKADAAIAAAVAAPTRTPANIARDKYRNPAETLAFFGVKGGDTIVELWPGAGWYSEILAPLAKAGGGTLYVAAPWERGLGRFKEKQAADAATYGAVKLAEFPATGAGPQVPDSSADVVLTFRNVHNWRFDGEDNTANAFRQIFAMLKPGGVLGVVDHRLDEDDDSAKEEKSGYMKESSIIAFAEAAGFKLAEKSEINANPKDTKDYEKGVWTLPPALREGEKDRDKYLAIGESDRMTLKFVKPAS